MQLEDGRMLKRHINQLRARSPTQKTVSFDSTTTPAIENKSEPEIDVRVHIPFAQIQQQQDEQEHHPPPKAQVEQPGVRRSARPVRPPNHLRDFIR